MLEAVGQFGTRLQGGKDAASARYIFTKLSPLARTLFPPQDDDVLEWLNDDGHPVEPKHYVPLIPLVLVREMTCAVYECVWSSFFTRVSVVQVNGTKGIGTGWSTDVPCFKPEDVIDNLLHRLRGDDPQKSMEPWFAGFTGEISLAGPSRFFSRGRVEQLNTTDVLISELPVGVWTQGYKE